MININILLKISIHWQEKRLWEFIKRSPKRKYLDLLSNSLNSFFKEMYRDHFGEFVCGYWGLKGLWEAWLYCCHKNLLLWPFVWNNNLCTISSFLFLFILACHCVTLSLPECLIGFCKVTLTFESVDEILWCHHSNESSLPVLSHDAICCLPKF